MTAHNTQITLTIAANYGGRWDMVQPVQARQAAQAQQPVSNWHWQQHSKLS